VLGVRGSPGFQKTKRVSKDTSGSMSATNWSVVVTESSLVTVTLAR
jgi:hypothetical protein